jgi:hypothetical protein
MKVHKESLVDWSVSQKGKVIFWIQKEKGCGYRLKSTRHFVVNINDFCIDFKDAKNTAKEYFCLFND